VIAYQMLSGEAPFKGTVAELMQQHREAAPAPLSKKRGDISAPLDAVVRQALAKEPSARPATAHPRQLKDKSFLLFEIEKGGRMI
jgi:serine/threonine-protein kinase